MRRRAREPGPSCGNCGLETEYLFDGFIYPTAARDKFVLNEPVKLSRKGMEAGLCRDSAKVGIVAGFARDGVCIKVQKMSRRGQYDTQPQYWHMDYWTPRFRKVRLNKHGTYGQPVPAKVCQRCRPPSNLEIEEMLSNAKTRRTKNTAHPRRRGELHLDDTPSEAEPLLLSSRHTVDAGRGA